jgi:DNA-binding HxlR family transcriptional regulator
MAKKIEKNTTRRSDCPVSCTMDLVGDKWSMLIIRDMMLWGKTTYNEFLNSNEKISTNILNDRLVMLTEVGLIQYTGTAKRKKYSLTAMGNDLRPVLEAIGTFGVKHFEGSKEYVKKQSRAPGNRVNGMDI